MPAAGDGHPGIRAAKSGDDLDWVLVLDDATKGFPAPGQGM